MIQIIGDTVDELADIQKLLEIGTLNSNEAGTIDVTYKLSFGGIILVDRYNHIVGKKELQASGLDVDGGYFTSTFQKTESYRK